jgi:hypothetical protein
MLGSPSSSLTLDNPPIDNQKIRLHKICDVKLDGTRKARLVANGNETEEPKESMFSSVVSRDSVRIFFTLAGLNFLRVLACDIQNAYLNADTEEKNLLHGRSQV